MDVAKYPMPESENLIIVEVPILLSNARSIKKRCTSRLLIVVKSRGYGFGLERSAVIAAEGGADYIGVTNIYEAEAVRKSLPSIPILVMSRLYSSEILSAIAIDADFWICSIEDLVSAQDLAAKAGQRVRVHVKLDLGLARFGVEDGEASAILRLARTMRNVETIGIAGHFTAAGGSDKAVALRELQRFSMFVEYVKGEGLLPPIAHLLNSSGFMRFGDAQFDMVRIGALFYGFRPTTFVPSPSWLRHALWWRSKVRFQHRRAKGSTVGYGGRAKLEADTYVAVAPIGFASGFRNTQDYNGNIVIVDDHICNVIGFVGLDSLLIDVGPRPVRDRADIFLLGDVDGLAIENLAARWRTSHYEIPATIRANDCIYL
jgi:alanine racemase